MAKFINEQPIEHSSSNGTTFKADRADLIGGVTVQAYSHTSEKDKMADFAEFAAWHTHCIFNQLNGFNGWSAVKYIHLECK